MVRIREAILVEGKYDKNTLRQIVDAPIFQTNGFGIFKDKEKMQFLRKTAEKRGLIVLADSDGAGFVIRRYIKSCIPGQFLKHAYIPDIAGKEKRKSSPGKEGKLGVEGMRPSVILQSLRRAGATFLDENVIEQKPNITKQDMVELGISGGKDSRFRRAALLKKLNFPEHMSANALLEALNVLYSLDELKTTLMALETDNG